MKFNELGLSDKVVAAVEAVGFSEPTPIQQQAIPFALQGRDVVGIAQTGTGKTASFVLPMLTKLERGRARARMPRSLILEPTRELAAQVAQSFEELGVNHKLTIALLIGGVSFDEQFRKLDRGADVLIATPGRLLDHFGRGKLLLTAVEIVVIDEADRMLDMGFIPDIEKICSLLPPSRQTLFFSATMPPEIEKLTARFLRTPERISVARKSMAAQTIRQRLKATSVEPKAKRAALRELLREENVKNAIVFCNRKRDVGVLHRSLSRHGFNSGELHGDMDQRQRTMTLDGFRSGQITILVASDVAARGLDVPEVSHVFNFDVPVHAEDYIHRIGRTGRAGREGCASTLVTPKDMAALREIEALCQSKIEWIGEGPAGIEAGTGDARRSRSQHAKRDEPSPEADAGQKSGEREKRKRGGRGRSRGRASATTQSENPKAVENIAATATATAIPRAPAAAPPATPNGNVRTAETSQKGNDRRRNRRRDGDGAGVIDTDDTLAFGMSDQVPAFLMRPIRRAEPDEN
jgi:superfamily II DNA/RNA helicase